MKKLHKKKVNLFGKEVSVLLIAMVAVLGVASAALIPYFGLLKGEVTVSQGLYLDNHSYDDPVVITMQDMTSLEEQTIFETHTLYNNATVNANGGFDNDCDWEKSGNDCEGIEYRTVEYFDEAGADFSDYYVNDSLCDYKIEATSLMSIPGTGIVCVKDGTYTGNVNIPANVVLVALNSPESGSKTTIFGSVEIIGENSTLKGFEIKPISGSSDAIRVSAGNAVVDSNIITNMQGTGSSINAIRVAKYSAGYMSNIEVTNNLIEDIANTGKGANGVMIQGAVENVKVRYNTIKNIVTENLSESWDYAMGIQMTTSGTTAVLGMSPLDIIVEYNHLENIQSIVEPGRGFGVDEQDHEINWSNAAEVISLKYNNFIGIENDLTNKDPDHTLVAEDNYFDELKVNVNGATKHEVGEINADYMNKTSFNINAGDSDMFGVFVYFPKMLVPDTYTVTTEVIA